MVNFHALWNIWKRVNTRYPRMVAWTKIGIIFGLFFIFSWQTLDPDFGWHLTAGNYIRHHGIPAHDLYTYTAHTYRWIDHEWGNDVLTSILYQCGGYGLTAGVFSAAWTAALCLFRRRIRFVLILVAAITVMPYAGIRPTVWTVLGISLLLELANRASRRAKITIPFLFLVWANLHGGFIIGLAIVAYFFMKNRDRSWLIVLVASILVTFINPYGPRLYIEIAHTLLDSQLHSQITEWRSFYLLPSGWLFLVIWAVGFRLYDSKKLQSLLAVTPFLVLASMSASRNLPLFVVSSLRDFDRYLTYFKLPKKLDRPSKAILASFIIFFGSVFGYYFYISYFPWTPNRYYSYPVQEVAYLRAHSCAGNLFNDYSYGGYLIWKLPGTLLYIDGRMPSWRDPEGEKYLDRYDAIVAKTKAQQTEFHEYDIRCALLATSGTDKRLVTSLKYQGWSTVSSGNKAILLEAPKSK